MENKDKIYEQFKDAADKGEAKNFNRMDAVWNRVEEKLDEKKTRRGIAWWKYSGAAAILLLFICIGNLIVRNDADPIITPNAIPENNVTAIDTQKIKEAFSPDKEIIVEEEVVVMNDEKKVSPYDKYNVGDTVYQPNGSYGIVTGKKGTKIRIMSPRSSQGEFRITGEITKNESDEVYYNKAARFTTSKDINNPEYYLYPSKIKFIPGEKRNDNITTTSSKYSKIDSTLAFTGTITDESGMPIPGVSVIVRGKESTQTDFDGKFTLNTKLGDTLRMAYIGMKTESLVANTANNHANVAMAGNSQMLSDVAIEAYRTTTRATSNVAVTTVGSQTYNGDKSIILKGRTTTHDKRTIASTDRGVAQNRSKITSITSEIIEGRPNASYIQTLQGQVPGLNITTGEGQPGSGTTVVLRGAGSLNGNPEPLYVIDGIPSSVTAARKINPNDIAEISVLKNEGATAIYGNRGSNGVIIVKTKKQLTKRQLRKLERLNEELKKQKAEEVAFHKIPETKIQVDTEDYEAFEENKFENPAVTPLSTFSIDVDNASYTNIRRFLNNGQTVPKDAVRVEEMINFFKYQYPQPKSNEPFSINTEYSDVPWNPKHKLLKIGLQGKSIPTDELPASNFVFLIDVSGSMSAQNKLPLLKQSMKMLVNQMRAKDRIAIVVYAGAAGLVLPSTGGDDKDKIITALENLNAGGSTAGGEGIELAYKTAQENFIKKGNNRVILATDGDFNVGASSNTDMQTLIEEKRKSGVFLTCLGYGMGNYKDSKMEILADKGNGNYAYIDNMQEADRFLQKEFKGSMYAIAKDVKIQIEFNPKHVQSYRLIGYENRKLRDEDFANDAIDAGELGSGHTVTALYEIIPTGVESDYFTNAPELKYSQPATTAGTYNDELATIKFRHKKPDEDVSKEIVKVIPNNAVPLEQATGDFKFSAAVAWFGLKLRDSELIPDKETKAISELAKEGIANDPDGYRAEFIRLVNMVE